LLGRLAASGAGVKVIIHTYHGHVFHSYFNKFISASIVKAEQLLAHLSTKLIAISHTQKHELVNTYHICRENKMEVIKLGIDNTRFHDDDGSRRKRFREKYHLAENEVAIGIIGRIVQVKGPAFFAAVVEEILRIPHPSVKFFVIGDGLLRKELQQLLLEKGISNSFSPAGKKPATVIFTSWILDIGEAMNGLDIIMLTSLNEGTPVTLLEAQAAGKPVVATNVGGVSEVVLDEVSGYILPYGDKQGFAAKVLRLAADPALRRSMGREGQAFMQKNHTQEQQFQSIEKLYLQLLEV
jgi:glycosyltransferase involved in cell wall biosynthesis